MIIIRAGHILNSFTSHTLEEVKELKLRAADLGVSEMCLEEFLDGTDVHATGDSNVSLTVHLVARDYQHRNHHTLLCAGGFVGKCTGDTALSASSSNLGSAGSRMPPELFTYLAKCFKSMYGFEPQEVTQFSKLSLVCRYWAQLYRPMQWRLASFRSPDRLDPFLSILNSTPKGLQSVAAFIVRVVVIAIGIPDQPWIHLIPLRLKRHLFSRKHPDRLPSFSLSIVLRTNGLPSASDKRVYMPATHDCLPKSLSLFNFQCQAVELTGVDFRTFEQFMVSVRAFRRLEDLTCTKVGWTTDPPERLVLLRTFAYPPLRRAMVQPFEVNGGFNMPHKPESHWVSALWCWARRRAVDGKHYLLEDHETMMAMKITSLFQGFWRRKSTPTLEMFVKERRRRDHHGEPLDVEGFDVCFAIDRRGYTFVFTLTADLSLTTPPDEARVRDDYYALHVQCITICCTSTIATHSDLGLGNLVDHAKFWKQVMELPFASLRNVVVAFARNTEGEVLQKTLQEHAPRLLNPGTRDTVARKLVIVQSDQDPPEEGCKWMKLDPATFEAKGPSCAWYDENDLRSPDNIHGLSRILV